MVKKKQTKKERLAKAKAQANKLTVGKVLDIDAFGGAAIHETLAYMKNKNIEHIKNSIPRAYTGMNFDAGTFDWHDLVRGYSGSVNREGEKRFFKFVGIKGPRSEIKTMNDVIDWVTYFGKSGIRAYDRKDDALSAHAAWYKVQNGVNLHVWEGGWDPMEMITDKEIPYILGKKIRQIPFVKRTMAKISKHLM